MFLFLDTIIFMSSEQTIVGVLSASSEQVVIRTTPSWFWSSVGRVTEVSREFFPVFC